MGRQYDIGESSFPSVTTILGLLDKPFLLPWAAEQAANYVIDNIKKLPCGCIDFDYAHPNKIDYTNIITAAKTAYQKVSGEAKDIGSQVHQLCEYYIKAVINNTELPSDKDYDDQTKVCFKQFLIWNDLYKPTWIGSEMTVYNPVLGYAGTLDAVCMIDEKIYVIDFKTDKQISDTYPLQISAYLEAYNQMTLSLNGVNTATAQGILRLPKDGQAYEWIDFTDKFERSLEAFKGLLTFYYHFKKRRLKNNPIVKRIWG